MKRLLLTILLVALIFSSRAQVMEPKWETCLGGTEWDEGTGITFANSTYWTIGTTKSNNGDISYNHGAWDLWLLNIDTTGSLISEKTFGGTYFDGGFVDIAKLNDSIFYIVSRTKSIDGDIENNPWPGPEGNYWIVQINDQGDILWENVHGGSGIEDLRDAIVTNDGGIITLGISTSNDGDISNPNGSWDLWMIKLDSNGEKQWDFSLGGEGHEEGGSVIQTSDGGYLITGDTDGKGGGNFDTACNYHDYNGIPGFSDVWIVKLDSLRNIEWQQCYGGTFLDAGLNILEAQDGYVCLAITMSNDGDVSGFHGVPDDLEYGFDIWVFKIDKQGNLLWQNCLGGLYYEWARNIFPTSDGGFMIVGTTQSDNGDVEGFNGYQAGGYDDVWFAKIDSLGNLTWQYCYGGLGWEYIYRGVYQKSDYNYVITIGTETDEWQCSEEDVAPPDVRVVELYDTTVGVDEKVSNTSDVEIYPNPTNSILNIVLPQNYKTENMVLEILDVNGRTFMQKKITSVFMQIDISNLKNGFYLVKLQNNKTLITKKIIIQ